jgi:hypothetical protein
MGQRLRAAGGQEALICCWSFGELRAIAARNMGVVRYDEPDIDLLKSLVTEKPWLAIGRDPVDARRMALMCALAWLAGAGTREMGRLRTGDWLNKGGPAILLTRANVTETTGRNRPPRPRLIFALPLLRRAVERRLLDMEGASADALLLSSPAPFDRSPRGFIETSHKWIASASCDTVGSLVELADRYKTYLTWSGEDPKIVWWTAGMIARAKDVAFAEVSKISHDYEPPLPVVKALLRRWHPAA